MSDTAAKLQAAKARMVAFAQKSPDLMKGFAAVSKTATREGALPSAHKELMAVVAAVVKGCDDCILYHVEAARKHGASEAMLVEALEVAIEMGGGPALMYAGKALEAYGSLGA
jgi:AhpD family alkylhydroperoxidase